MNVLPIIILNWNGTDDTIECLNSLENQTYNNFHIYLIDNNSKKEELDKLIKFVKNKKNINFILNSSNLGFAGAHNKIFKEIINEGKYDFVFLLNNDTVVEKEFVESIWRRIEQSPKTGMVSTKMINYHNKETINNLGHKLLNTGEILPIGNNEPIEKYTSSFHNAGASGGGALYSVNMLKSIGIFDNYFVTGYEDAELGVRALITGYELIFDPDIIIYHKVGASVNKIRDYEFTLKIQLDILYSYFKLMPIPVIIVNAPFYFVRTIVLLLLFLFTFRLKYFKIFFKGWYLFLTKELKKTKAERNKIKPQIKLSSFQIIKQQEFFLIDNIRRFWIYFINRKKTIFELYK